MAEGEKFSRHVHVRRGALGGWHEDQLAETRHRHLEKVAKRDGWGTVARRLNYIANVASRRTNKQLRRIARRDLRWVERNERARAYREI